MYTKKDIDQIYNNDLHYFKTSFGYTFKILTSKERDQIQKCMKAMGSARLIYDLDYRDYYLNKGKSDD